MSRRPSSHQRTSGSTRNISEQSSRRSFPGTPDMVNDGIPEQLPLPLQKALENNNKGLSAQYGKELNAAISLLKLENENLLRRERREVQTAANSAFEKTKRLEEELASTKRENQNLQRQLERLSIKFEVERSNIMEQREQILFLAGKGVGDRLSATDRAHKRGEEGEKLSEGGDALTSGLETGFFDASSAFSAALSRKAGAATGTAAPSGMADIFSGVFSPGGDTRAGGGILVMSKVFSRQQLSYFLWLFLGWNYTLVVYAVKGLLWLIAPLVAVVGALSAPVDIVVECVSIARLSLRTIKKGRIGVFIKADGEVSSSEEDDEMVDDEEHEDDDQDVDDQDMFLGIHGMDAYTNEIGTRSRGGLSGLQKDCAPSFTINRLDTHYVLRSEKSIMGVPSEGSAVTRDEAGAFRTLLWTNVLLDKVLKYHQVLSALRTPYNKHGISFADASATLNKCINRRNTSQFVHAVSSLVSKLQGKTLSSQKDSPDSTEKLAEKVNDFDTKSSDCNRSKNVYKEIISYCTKSGIRILSLVRNARTVTGFPSYCSNPFNSAPILYTDPPSCRHAIVITTFIAPLIQALYDEEFTEVLTIYEQYSAELKELLTLDISAEANRVLSLASSALEAVNSNESNDSTDSEDYEKPQSSPALDDELLDEIVGLIHLMLIKTLFRAAANALRVIKTINTQGKMAEVVRIDFRHLREMVSLLAHDLHANSSAGIGNNPPLYAKEVMKSLAQTDGMAINRHQTGHAQEGTASAEQIGVGGVPPNSRDTRLFMYRVHTTSSSYAGELVSVNNDMSATSAIELQSDFDLFIRTPLPGHWVSLLHELRSHCSTDSAFTSTAGGIIVGADCGISLCRGEASQKSEKFSLTSSGSNPYSKEDSLEFAGGGVSTEQGLPCAYPVASVASAVNFVPADLFAIHSVLFLKRARILPRALLEGYFTFTHTLKTVCLESGVLEALVSVAASVINAMADSGVRDRTHCSSSDPLWTGVSGNAPGGEGGMGRTRDERRLQTFLNRYGKGGILTSDTLRAWQRHRARKIYPHGLRQQSLHDIFGNANTRTAGGKRAARGAPVAKEHPVDESRSPDDEIAKRKAVKGKTVSFKVKTPNETSPVPSPPRQPETPFEIQATPRTPHSARDFFSSKTERTVLDRLTEGDFDPN